MKILITQNEYALSGAALCAFQIATHLKEQGHDVFAVSCQNGEMVSLYADKQIQAIVNPHIFTDAKIAYELAKQVDLVIAFTSVAYQTVFGAKGAGKPVIFSIHEMDELGINWARDNIFFRQALNIADQVVFTCEHAIKQFKPYLKHNNVSLGLVGVDPIDNSTFPKNDTGRFRAIVVGSIEPRKNQLSAIAAMKDISNSELTILGRQLNPQYSVAVLNAAKEAKNVNVTLPMLPAEVPKLVNQHDVVLCTSVDETIPRVVMEGMALGKCVVSSTIAGIPEVISNNETGILYNVHNIPALKEILMDLSQNPEKTKTIGKAARKAIKEKFNASQYLKSFTDLVDKWKN